MATYQDVIRSSGAVASWALVEGGGTDFAPWLGGSHLTGAGTLSHQQPGPFAAAFGLGLAVGASLRLAFLSTVQPPASYEVWAKLASATPAAAQMILYAGNPASNGSGIYVATNGHIHSLKGGVGDTDTGILWPDTNWHLVDLVGISSTVGGIALDGQLIWRATTGAAVAPSPNTLGFGSDSSNGAAIAVVVSYPTIYFHELSTTELASHFLAATDPDAALIGGTGPFADILELILEAVRPTYSNP